MKSKKKVPAGAKKRQVSKTAANTKHTKRTAAKKSSPVAKQPLITALGVKVIPAVGYNFDDVMDNVEKLLDFYFPDSSRRIREKVLRLSSKYSERIDGDYEYFLDLHNSKRELQKWYYTAVPNAEKISPLEFDILDLYYQVNMVFNYDVYNDILIYAYLEDIQPKLN